MKKNLLAYAIKPGGKSLVLMILVLLVGVAMPAAAEDLEELLTQVGEDYAVSYTSPFLYAHGPNQNSGTFHTAKIPWGKLTFGVGVKVMATQLNSDDQNFSKNIEDVNLGDYDSDFEGETGDVVMKGPTIFGDTETAGTITGYLHGIPVFEMESITGLINTTSVPLFAPEAYIGGIFGLKATIRYFPEMELGDYGKTEYLGYGLQWSPNGLMPTFPVDLAIGFFDQELNVGSMIQSNANTMFLAASKDFSLLRVYGGYSFDKSDMTVSYVEQVSGLGVEFAVDGRQEGHATIGVALNFILGVNLEMNVGDLTTYSAGLMLGF